MTIKERLEQIAAHEGEGDQLTYSGSDAEWMRRAIRDLLPEVEALEAERDRLREALERAEFELRARAAHPEAGKLTRETYEQLRTALSSPDPTATKGEE